MLNIPIYIFLFLYLLFLCLFVVFSIINIYHIVMSASFTLASFIITFFMMALTIFTLYFTFELIKNADWTQTITIFNIDWITGIFLQKTF
jgi:hypothetical protein